MSNFVYPGKCIGAAEEALAGNGAYEKNHEIYAFFAGRVIREHGELSVLPKKEIILLHQGQIIYGIVADVMENFALIEIEALIKGRERLCTPTDYGILRVMNIRDGFVPSAKDEVKIGDIIKARVEDIKPSISLSTKEFELGVVRAYCAECRHVMNAYASVLKCAKCGATDKRKLSKSYGREIILNEIKF